MPTALSTTKRKFHRILDSISNTSSTSLATRNDKYNVSTATLPTTMDPPSKKPRVARPTSAYVRPSTRTEAVSRTPASRATPVPTTRPASSSTVNEERKPPNFAPWDRGQFLERLKTYRHVDKWMGKQDRISEVEWAKRGWSCVGKERVECVGGCGREVVIKLESDPEERGTGEEEAEPSEEDAEEWCEDAQEKLVEKYAEMTASAHDGGYTIHRLPIANHNTALAALRERYTSLVAISSDLPPTLSTPPSLDTTKTLTLLTPLLTSNPPSSPTTTPSPHPALNKTALTLSLFGWHPEPSHITGLITCPACFRRLGLWLFQPPSNPTEVASMHRLDVVAEHRDYCPWINAVSQNGGGQRSSLEGLAGWEVLLRGITASAAHRRADSAGVDGPGRVGGEPAEGDGEENGSEVGMVADSVMGDEKAAREERDKERWAKLKKLRQVFRVGKRKGVGGGGVVTG